MSAAVIMAKVAWNAMKTMCGIVPLGSRPTPRSPAIEKSPTRLFPSPKASEYASTAQSTADTPSATKHIIIVFRAFREFTRPP